MSVSLPGHLLVGVPGSGKTTFAREWIRRDPAYVLVSTDRIRQDFYGDEAIQGDWSAVEAEVLRRIQAAVAEGRGVIYDATNARRAWRLAFLERVQHTMGDRSLSWIAWHLQVPGELCKQRNQQRRRVVPGHVIEEMSTALQRTPPVAAEGFWDVQEVPLDGEGWFDFSEVFRRLDRTPLRVSRRRNRTRAVVWHPYGRLLDFERLMYLLAMLLDTSRDRGETAATVGEIAQALARQQGAVYADEAALAADLGWLAENGFFDEPSSRPVQLSPCARPPETDAHRYSDLTVFRRLMETIRAILQVPCERRPERPTLESLVALVNRRGKVTDRNGLRKDIELALYPYGLLQPGDNYRGGYYLGTAIFSVSELQWLYQQLQGLGDRLGRASDRQVYGRLMSRLVRSQLLEVQHPFPVKRFGNPDIIEPKGLSHVSLARQIERVERAIGDGELLSMQRLQGYGRFPQDLEAMQAYPLQLVFHNIAWYLGVERKADGLLSFERLDRWGLQTNYTQVYRSQEAHRRSLGRLQRLYEASAGLFLGRSAAEQQAYLGDGRQRKAVTVAVELWCDAVSFAFISEGTQRFQLSKMRMSPPPREMDSPTPELLKLFSGKRTPDPQFPHRFRVELPGWAVEDIDLQRWILGFGGRVKVMSPPRLQEIVRELGRSIWGVYEG